MKHVGWTFNCDDRRSLNDTEESYMCAYTGPDHPLKNWIEKRFEAISWIGHGPALRMIVYVTAEQYFEIGDEVTWTCVLDTYKLFKKRRMCLVLEIVEKAEETNYSYTIGKIIQKFKNIEPAIIACKLLLKN